MQSASKKFADSLAKYAQAIAEGRIDDAVLHAKLIPKYGDLVVIHPDFLHYFNSAHPQINAKETLDQAGKLLLCVAESMRQALHHSSQSTTSSDDAVS